MMEWISVDSPPKEHGEVLVFRSNGHITIVHFHGAFYGVRASMVTHWMPLPEPPKP